MFLAPYGGHAQRPAFWVGPSYKKNYLIIAGVGRNCHQVLGFGSAAEQNWDTRTLLASALN
jgi:hypothetical protein